MGSFMILNLFIGVISNSMEEAREELEQEERDANKPKKTEQKAVGSKTVFDKFEQIIGGDDLPWSLESLKTEMEQCENKEVTNRIKATRRRNLLNFLDKLKRNNKNR